MAWDSKKGSMNNNLIIGAVVVAGGLVYLFFTEKGKVLKSTIMGWFKKA